MKRNVGGIDRLLRAVLGLVLMCLVWVGPRTPWGWLGVVPLLTAVFQWCPAYALLRIDSCRAKALVSR